MGYGLAKPVDGDSVRSLMDGCLSEMQKLTKDKDKAIEDYLEEFAEEKVSCQLEIKMKY